MAGRSGRTYVRDANGRFASGGGGGGGKRAASGGKGKGKGKAAPAAAAAAPKKGKAAAAAPAPAAPPASTKGRFRNVFKGAVSRVEKRRIAAPVRAAEQKLRQAQMNAGSYSGANKARAAKSALSRAKNTAANAMTLARVVSGERRDRSIRGTRVAGTISKRRPAAAPAPAAPAPAPKKGKGKGKAAAPATGAAAPRKARTAGKGKGSAAATPAPAASKPKGKGRSPRQSGGSSVAAGRKAKARYKLAESKKRYKAMIRREQVPIPYNQPGGTRF